MNRNKEHRPNGAAAEGGASVFFDSAHLSFYIMNIYGYSVYNPYVFHMYICPKYFHIFSFVCILKIMNLLSKTHDFIKNHTFA